MYGENFEICGGRPTQDPNRGSMRHLFTSVCFSSGYLLPALQPFQPSSPPAFQPSAIQPSSLPAFQPSSLPTLQPSSPPTPTFQSSKVGGLEGWTGGLGAWRLRGWSLSQTEGEVVSSAAACCFFFRVYQHWAAQRQCPRR